MTIIVEVKNEILGDSEFWRGDESRIAEIRNIPARMTAEQVVADSIRNHCLRYGVHRTTVRRKMLQGMSLEETLMQKQTKKPARYN